ncbi:hypothetical protein [Paludisphaera soli]|uniref:hypothetical protein n=1 Tax=Paludisphaera soli TaxID=2712865 RepID=UPI0013EC8411|nr:hypothetical protein [Paludisphaera soli]
MHDQAIAAKPPRRFRRLVRWIAVLSILLLLVLASMPTVLSTPPARRMLVRAINQKLHPGRVELGGASLSWNRGIVLRDVALIDPRGKTVATAESVRTDRGLVGLLRSGSDYGTIHVDGATADFERRADGSIDALEAVGGLLAPSVAAEPGPVAPAPAAGSGLAVTVVVKGGRARIASPELAEPIVAGAFEAEAKVLPGKPVGVTVKLREGERSLELLAAYDMASADQTLTFEGKDWPLAMKQAGYRAEGRLAGVLQAERKQGLWSARSDAVLHGFAAEGPGLGGDRLALESVAAEGDVRRTELGWSIGKLDVKSAIGELTAAGDLPATAGTPTRLTGQVDLAAAAKLLPRAIPLREGIVLEEGRARVAADLSRIEGVERLRVSADVTDLTATENGRALTLQKPATLTAALVRDGATIAVESFAVKAAGVDAKATGDLDSGVKLSGVVDLAAVDAQARELIDLGAVKFAGKGRLAADYRPDGGRFKARLAAEFDGLRVEGFTEDPIERDHARVDGASNGPRGANGLPTAWDAVRLAVDAGATKLSVLVKEPAGDATFTLEGSTPVTAPAPAVVSAKVALRRAGRVYQLDDVQATATPTDPQAASAVIALHAKGEYDPAAGRLVLIPVGAQPSQGLAVGPEGFMLSGLGKPDAPMGFDGVLRGDLAALDGALAYWMQAAPKGLGGAWSGRATLARHQDGRLDFKGYATSPDLIMTTPRGPVTLTLDGTYTPSGDHVSLTSFDLSTAHARLAGTGTIAEFGANRIADVSAVLEPRWETLDPILAAAVEPGAQVRATVKPFHLKGSLAAGSTSQILKGMEGVLEVDLASARAFGMEVGPTPLVLRMGGGRAAFDPIATTLNGGRMEIAADLMVDDPDALWLRMAEGTRIEGAAINKAVSDDVLSYIAPVLAKSSNVSGQVSLTVAGAAIPLMGDGALRVDGQLVFQDVVFQPGPFGSELLALTGRPERKLTLQQPLQLQIADGRVRQSGLTFPLGDDLTAKLDGSVGFDKTLAMRATVPITPQMLGGNAVAREFVAGTDITLPIGGTISNPTIDRNGLRVALKEAARSMVRRGVQAEANRLIDRVLPPSAAGGRDPNAPSGSLGRDALKALEGIGRDLAQPKRR